MCFFYLRCLSPSLSLVCLFLLVTPTWFGFGLSHLNAWQKTKRKTRKNVAQSNPWYCPSNSGLMFPTQLPIGQLYRSVSFFWERTIQLNCRQLLSCRGRNCLSSTKSNSSGINQREEKVKGERERESVAEPSSMGMSNWTEVQSLLQKGSHNSLRWVQLLSPSLSIFLPLSLECFRLSGAYHNKRSSKNLNRNLKPII